MTDLLQPNPPHRAPWPPPRPEDVVLARGTSGERPRGANLRLSLLIGVVLAVGVLWGWSWVVVIVALLVMIFLHELGHYLTAKWAGMKVTEFFIGFGPRLWSFRRGETEYGVKAVPLGAYVRIIGMHNLDPVPAVDEDRAYRNKPYWRRLSVAVAGSFMHFVIAAVLLFALLVGWGVPDQSRWVVAEVSGLEGSGAPPPAQQAGIVAGDEIVSIDGITIDDWSELVLYVRAHPGKEVDLVVRRGDTTFDTSATLAVRTLPDGTTAGFLGVAPERPLVRQDPLSAVPRTFTTLGDWSWMSLKALGSFFTPGALGDYFDQLGGSAETPGGGTAVGQGDNRVISIYGATRLASQAAESSVPDLLLMLITLNIFVGIFNMVPLLPLDGGHVAIATYERIRSRKGRPYHADVRKMMPIAYATVAFLGLMFITSLYLDVTSPIANPFQR